MSARIALGLALVCALVGCNEPTSSNNVVSPGQFVAVTTGRYHACAIDTIGRGWCWGDDTYGQSGSTTQLCTGCTVAPAPIETSLRFTAISAGSYHTCALVADGTAYCWGDAQFGQLGLPTVGSCTGVHTCSATPVAVYGGYRFKSITGGSYGTCAITTTDVLKCWGYQGFNNAVLSSVPTTVRYQGTGDSLWSAVGHTDGGLNGCGLTINGVAACWGPNYYGQLGVGSVFNQRSNPTAITLDVVVKSVSSGSGFSCALSNIGDAYCWGLNYHGGLGVGADAVTTPCSATTPDTCLPTPLKVIGGRTYSQLAVGTDHVCGLDVITSEAYCWGSNTYSAIGSFALGVNPIAPSPFAAGNGTKYPSLSVGTFFTCGLMADKTISCWGSNVFGQLGRKPTELFSTGVPVRITGSAP